jgi:hypothetical protein
MKSHTSTPEWQRFETRMRRRLVERCLLRASAALDADAPDMAKDVLEEARAIWPGHPEIDVLAERLVSSVPLSPQPPKRLTRWGATIVALLGFGLGWGGVWASTPKGAAALTELTTTATTAASHVVKIATRARVPQSV